MPNIRWKSVGRMLFAASFAYLAVFLLGPGHIVKAYVQWGYPPWAHFVAGFLFLSAAILCRFAAHAGPALQSRAVCWVWLRRLALFTATSPTPFKAHRSSP
jgi:hypothetical protein